MIFSSEILWFIFTEYFSIKCTKFGQDAFRYNISMVHCLWVTLFLQSVYYTVYVYACVLAHLCRGVCVQAVYSTKATASSPLPSVSSMCSQNGPSLPYHFKCNFQCSWKTWNIREMKGYQKCQELGKSYFQQKTQNLSAQLLHIADLLLFWFLLSLSLLMLLFLPLGRCILQLKLCLWETWALSNSCH